MSEVSLAPGFVCDDGVRASETLVLPFPLPSGEMAEAACIPATATTALTEGGKHAFVALCVGEIGIYAPVTAKQLRNMASAYLQMADLIDGGIGKQ